MFVRMESVRKKSSPRPAMSLASGSLLAVAFALSGCQDQGAGPAVLPPAPCEDASVLKPNRPLKAFHNKPMRVKGTPADLPRTVWASASEVQTFFGNKPVKVVFTASRRMYLLEYAGGEAVVTKISSGDESLSGLDGSICSPLFSPDGKKITYNGTIQGRPGFIRDAVGGDAEAVRIPLDTKSGVTADPHWHIAEGKTWIYYSTKFGLVGYNKDCNQIQGATYRKEVLGDSMGPAQITGIPGSYRGGVSLDGMWAGTSYSAAAIFDRQRDTTIIIDGGAQKCNASMNPFPIGSLRSDYMMLLGFGGAGYRSIEGNLIYEEQHENFWIHNRDDKVVWQAQRPDSATYYRWEKPEWSTHPEYATAIALRPDDDGDLYVVRIGDLANAEEGKLHQAQGYLKIASFGFNSDSYSHLWVGE